MLSLLRTLFKGSQSGTPTTFDYEATPVPDMPGAFAISTPDENGNMSSNGVTVYACSWECASNHPAPRS